MEDDNSKSNAFGDDSHHFQFSGLYNNVNSNESNAFGDDSLNFQFSMSKLVIKMTVLTV
jgi:hypothetical protein